MLNRVNDTHTHTWKQCKCGAGQGDIFLDFCVWLTEESIRPGRARRSHVMLQFNKQPTRCHVLHKKRWKLTFDDLTVHSVRMSTFFPHGCQRCKDDVKMMLGVRLMMYVNVTDHLLIICTYVNEYVYFRRCYRHCPHSSSLPSCWHGCWAAHPPGGSSESEEQTCTSPSLPTSWRSVPVQLPASCSEAFL